MSKLYTRNQGNVETTSILMKWKHPSKNKLKWIIKKVISSIYISDSKSISEDYAESIENSSIILSTLSLLDVGILLIKQKFIK